MSKTRTFIAVAVPSDVASTIADLSRKLARGVDGVKWVATENLHFTLKFLGDVEDNDLHEVCSAAIAAARDVPSFDLSVAGTGAFPSAARPRTVWIGAGEGSEPFIALQDRVDRAMIGLGFRRESRQFVPHLTIGRVRHGNPSLVRLTNHLAEHAGDELGTICVDEVLILSSKLLPDGPEYHVLGRGPLAK